MCDTFVALAAATGAEVILGKNSDRDPNEAHELVLAAGAEHQAGDVVRTTYLRIPQVSRTHAVLLAKPFWVWGAEMGVNECGVAIGNEAVFTKAAPEPDPGLIGMDLVRLALERAGSAEEAVDVVTSLLQRHGQGGNCGYDHRLAYDNSFIVADRREAWVLETAGRDWAARRVARYASISNAITIGRDWERASSTLVATALGEGWSSRPDDFDFGRDASDRLYTRFSQARLRQCRTEGGLAASQGQVDVRLAKRLLRDHGDVGRSWSPADALLGQQVCAHAGFGPVRVSQSTGSMVVQLPASGPPTIWLTGTSAPCTSVFKPVWLDGGLPDLGPAPTGHYDPVALWWRHEDLHRATLRDWSALADYAVARDVLEAELRHAAAAALAGTAADRQACTRESFRRADQAEQGWTRQVLTRSSMGERRQPLRHRPHAAAWAHWDIEAGRKAGQR